MDIRKLQRTIVDGLEDVKAQDIAVFNTEQLSALFERVIIASGTSNRQTKALAANVRDTVREQGGTILGMEGEDNGEWIIVDCGSAVVHIMQPAIRQYYHLEEIWGAKPVKMKLASETRSLVKASEDLEPEPEHGGANSPRKLAAQRLSGSAAEARQPARKKAASDESAPARKRAAKKPVTVKAGTMAGKAAVAKAASIAAKTAASPAAKKAAAARKPAARKTVAPAESAPVPVLVVPPPKSAAKKAPARKAPAKKAATRSPAAKKAAPRKSKPAA
ncbi:MAG: ribosome silencing factor [Leptothrix sp. (in: b-proteobacteria)]